MLSYQTNHVKKVKISTCALANRIMKNSSLHESHKPSKSYERGFYFYF